MNDAKSPKQLTPFKQWGIGFAATLAVSLVLFFFLGSWISILSIIAGISLLVWGCYEAYRGNFFILLGIVSTPFVIGFVFLIICGGLVLSLNF